MGRKPLGQKAMTDAERQARRRKKIRKEKLKLGKKAEKEKARLKAAKEYIPVPPGITYWYEVEVEGKKIWQPRTQPLPSMYWERLREEDLTYLIERASKELELRKQGKRGHHSGMSVFEPLK